MLEGGTLPPIVVADDDAQARRLIAAFLQRLRVANPVAVAESGPEAVALLETLDPPPALALLDIRMPGSTGLDVLRWVRAQDRLRRLPVILLTGAAEIDEVNEAHELGVSSYLVKPVGYEALGEVLRSLELPWAFQDAGVRGGAPRGR